ncbi:EF-P lysine aminoacylase GenX [bacterium]|nr:EF-P lysine aminoacylase GenX [candidate division CSSED10-310 bacterium]
MEERRFRTARIGEMTNVQHQAVLAGRVVAAGSGRLALQDASGTIPLHFDTRVDSCAAGDLVSVHGMGTRSGFNVTEFQVHTKSSGSIESFPPIQVLRERMRCLAEIRAFFTARDFLEVETPALTPAPDLTPAIRCFETRFHPEVGEPVPLFLHTSPETHMKRLLSAGCERIFQICTFFRDGECGRLHNPEFTGIEWYEAYTDYQAVMTTTEALVRSVLLPRLDGVLERDGRRLDLTGGWRREPFFGLIEQAVGLDLEGIETPKRVSRLLREKGLHTAPDDTLEDLLLRVFVHAVEGDLGWPAPIFVIDYPRCLGAMARARDGSPHLVERFELYIAGIELCNGYSELNDRSEQLFRFERDRHIKYPLGGIPLDSRFLDAMRAGIPPAGGNALGFDRLLMLALEKHSIEDVRLFPLAAEIESE